MELSNISISLLFKLSIDSLPISSKEETIPFQSDLNLLPLLLKASSNGLKDKVKMLLTTEIAISPREIKESIAI